jgi:hypothetical protein
MSLVNATLTDSAASVFTCANVKGTAVVTMFLKNHDTSARVVTVHACPADEAAADENMLLEVSIPANDTYVITDKVLLANTDTIKALASVTSVCSMTVSYMDL